MNTSQPTPDIPGKELGAPWNSSPSLGQEPKPNQTETVASETSERSGRCWEDQVSLKATGGNTTGVKRMERATVRANSVDQFCLGSGHESIQDKDV